MVELLALMIPFHLGETPYFIKPEVWLRNKAYTHKKMMEKIQHDWHGQIR
jgi:hypothetical protein